MHWELEIIIGETSKFTNTTMASNFLLVTISEKSNLWNYHL